jgi:hypothetical protein
MTQIRSWRRNFNGNENTVERPKRAPRVEGSVCGILRIGDADHALNSV